MEIPKRSAQVINIRSIQNILTLLNSTIFISYRRIRKDFRSKKRLCFSYSHAFTFTFTPCPLALSVVHERVCHGVRAVRFDTFHLLQLVPVEHPPISIRIVLEVLRKLFFVAFRCEEAIHFPQFAWDVRINWEVESQYRTERRQCRRVQYYVHSWPLNVVCYHRPLVVAVAVALFNNC